MENRRITSIAQSLLGSALMLTSACSQESDEVTFRIGDGEVSASSQTSEGDEEPREGECDPNPFPDNNPGPGSLRGEPVPEPSNLADFVRNRSAAIALGKALFWDMQVGSDGVQACASCHFRAGADPRVKNQVSPGGENNTASGFDVGGPNATLTTADFPLRRLSDPANRFSAVLNDSDDVISSMGVALADFIEADPGAPADVTASVPDPVFHVGGLNTRRVERRNTPTVINAVFNRRNFWDGRADELFNGVSVFGARDANAAVFRRVAPGVVEPTKVRIDNGSLASQAVGPPLSFFEMGAQNRPFAAVGRRLLGARPLAGQVVAWDDSVLGPLARSNPHHERTGLLVNRYDLLVFAAFESEWWFAPTEIIVVDTAGQPRVEHRHPGPLADNEFTLAEYNFSLFFGLAIQLYESTLITDDAPVDRFFDGDESALTEQQLHGLELFEESGCADCHQGPEFSAATVRPTGPERIERMLNGNCNVIVYDQGFYNIGVRPAHEDLGVGNNDPFGNPLSIARLLTTDPSEIPTQELLEIEYPNLLDPPPIIGEPIDGGGAFKIPSLRNVELTAPYFHNGGQATLRQVVEFYNRGSDFREDALDNIDLGIGALGLDSEEIDAIVAFLLGLTDERVLAQVAPFDHPQLFVADGHEGDEVSVSGSDGVADDAIIEIPAVGRHGGPAPAGFLE